MTMPSFTPVAHTAEAKAPARRLLSITAALRISGAPAPTAGQLVLLARYVAGSVTLRDILPALELPGA